MGKFALFAALVTQDSVILKTKTGLTLTGPVKVTAIEAESGTSDRNVTHFNVTCFDIRNGHQFTIFVQTID